MKQFIAVLLEDLFTKRDELLLAAGEKIQVVDVIDENAVFCINGKVMWAQAAHFKQV